MIRFSAWLAIALLLFPASALAYRPFDQTDAAVASERDIELEVGPGQFAADPNQRLYDPSFVFNYGAIPRLELVLDTQVLVPLRGVGSPEFESALLAKLVLRQGVLQGHRGPSIATELGLLLPDLPAIDGIDTGASGALIVSEQWTNLTVHANAFVALTRDHLFDGVVGAIFEGPRRWALRPVAEAWVQRSDGFTNASVLGGGIWRFSDGLDVDAALRVAHESDLLVCELRIGFTFSFSVAR